MRISALVILMMYLLSSCSIKRYVPEGQGLYVGNRVKVVADTISKPNVSGLDDQLEAIIKPSPNKTYLDFPGRSGFTIGSENPRMKVAYEAGSAKNLESLLSLLRNVL